MNHLAKYHPEHHHRKPKETKLLEPNSTKIHYGDDDTPKAFARLMSDLPSHKRKRGGQEDTGAAKPAKKGKTQGTHDSGASGTSNGKQSPPRLQIQPGESLRAFSRRVDAAMPVKFKSQGKLKMEEVRVGGKVDQVGKKKQVLALATPQPPPGDEEDYSDYLTDSSDAYSIDSKGEPRPKTFHARKTRPSKKSSTGKKRKPRGPSPDPFAVLTELRGKARFGETAEAPPVFVAKPKELLRARSAVTVDGVPKASGSIAKREVLAVIRRSVVEKYREVMEERRAANGG